MEETLLYSFLCVFLLVLAIKFLLTRKQRRNHPPGPPALPIIGHLHLLKGPIHKALFNLSQRYGPIMSLKFGSRFAVVVSSPSAVEECFTKNDIVFANRPHSITGTHLYYNNSTLVAARYGDHWRNLRRLSATEIFSSGRLNKFLGIRREEVKILLRRLHQISSHGFARVELRPLLIDLMFNTILRMVAGKRYYGEDVSGIEEAKNFREIMEDYFETSSVANPVDLFPILQWFYQGGYVKKLIKLGSKMDSFLQGLVDEHRVDKERNTMINHLLTWQESEPEYYTDETIKALILIMLLAGTETTSTSLEWAMANLLNYPDVLNRAKEELDAQIGHDRLMDEVDFSNLPYLQNIILENLRLCPVAPLLVPHKSSEDCTVGGYDIPAGTMLMVNAWAIHRNSELWDDAINFKPERFENGKVEAFKLLPFGMGRRACPGEGLANRVLGLTLGSLIQCFEWQRVNEKKIDMTEKVSITMSKVEPLEVMCKVRPNLIKVIS